MRQEPFDRRKRVLVDQQWKSRPSTVERKDRVARRARPFQHFLQKRFADARHVAGKKENSFGQSAFQARVDAAQRSAPRNLIVSNHANRPLQSEGGFPDVRQQSPPADAQSGFVPSHPGAQSSGQNANFDRCIFDGFQCNPIIGNFSPVPK